MTWEVVGVRAPSRLVELCRVAVGASDARMRDTVTDLAVPEDATGLVVVGDDADLAAVALAVHASGRTLPIALVPRATSDLLRMFGLDRGAMIDRLPSGSPYRCDLGLCHIGAATIPFASHVEAVGRWGRWSPNRTVGITTVRRSSVPSGWRFVAANAQHLRGAAVAPRSAVMDGQLDLQVLGGGWLARHRTLRRTRAGVHLGDPAVWRRQSPAATVTCPSGWQVRGDGVPIGSGPFSVEIVPAAFDLWI